MLTQTLKKGEYFTHDFSKDNFKCYKIISGVCKIVVTNSDLDEFTFSMHFEGEVVKPICYISDIESVEIKAVTKSEIQIYNLGLFSPIHKSLIVSTYMFEKSSDNKIMGFLKQISNRIGREDSTYGIDGLVIPMKLTHREISEALGLTRVTVTKTLGVLKKSGRLYFTRDRKFLLPL